MTSPRSSLSFQIPRPSRSLQAATPASDPLKPKPHDSQVFLPVPTPASRSRFRHKLYGLGARELELLRRRYPALSPPRACVMHSIWSVGRGLQRVALGAGDAEAGAGLSWRRGGCAVFKSGTWAPPGEGDGLLISPHWSFVATFPEQKEQQQASKYESA
jgi:hypothetical protein